VDKIKICHKDTRQLWTWFIWLRIGTPWWAVGGMVMNLWVPQNSGNFLIKSIVISFSEGCFLELVG